MLSTNFETLKVGAALPVQLCTTTSTAVLHAVVQKKIKKKGTPPHSQNIFIALIFNFNFLKIFYFILFNGSDLNLNH